jgi:hypothetical protein
MKQYSLNEAIFRRCAGGVPAVCRCVPVDLQCADSVPRQGVIGVIHSNVMYCLI